MQKNERNKYIHHFLDPEEDVNTLEVAHKNLKI